LNGKASVSLPSAFEKKQMFFKGLILKMVAEGKGLLKPKKTAR
jgi:hypothetical protein